MTGGLLTLRLFSVLTWQFAEQDSAHFEAAISHYESGSEYFCPQYSRPLNSGLETIMY